MEDFSTNENKLNFVQKEARLMMDEDGMVKWDDCVAIIEKVSSTSSKTVVENLLADVDQGDGRIESTALKEIIVHLFSKKNDNQCDIEDLPDVEEEHQRTADYVQALFELTKKGDVNKQMMVDLAKQYKLSLKE